ncbi:hypothetical protein JCM5350_004321 [Sporobolomyces pararoseus]
MQGIVYRDHDTSPVERETAHKAVKIYAQFFKSCEDLVHPDWKHDWPTDYDIKTNYLVHARSFAQDDMGVNVAIDVQGGPVRVNYKLKSGGGNRRADTPRSAVTPLSIYTRIRVYNDRTPLSEYNRLDSEWNSELEKLVTGPAALKRGRSTDEELPIDVAWPRHLELRSQRFNYGTVSRLFPKDPPRSTMLDPFSMVKHYVDPVSSKEFRVKLTQLNVEVPEGNFYSPPTTNYDDRDDGAPSTMLKTYILLEVADHTTDQNEFSALLRVRIAESEERGVKVGKKWFPRMAAHEGTPQERRDGTLVRVARRRQLSTSQQSPSPHEISQPRSEASPAPVVPPPPTFSYHPKNSNFLINHFVPKFDAPGPTNYRSLGIRQRGIYRQLSTASDRRF